MERNPPCLLLLKTKCNFKNLVEEEEVVTGSIISAGQENGQARKEQLKKTSVYTKEYLSIKCHLPKNYTLCLEVTCVNLVYFFRTQTLFQETTDNVLLNCLIDGAVLDKT